MQSQENMRTHPGGASHGQSGTETASRADREQPPRMVRLKGSHTTRRSCGLSVETEAQRQMKLHPDTPASTIEAPRPAPVVGRCGSGGGWSSDGCGDSLGWRGGLGRRGRSIASASAAAARTGALMKGALCTPNGTLTSAGRALGQMQKGVLVHNEHA